MRVSVLIPETNPSFDTYRIGTVLELCRDAVLEQALKGKRVKFCVQGEYESFPSLPTAPLVAEADHNNFGCRSAWGRYLQWAATFPEWGSHYHGGSCKP